MSAAQPVQFGRVPTAIIASGICWRCERDAVLAALGADRGRA